MVEGLKGLKGAANHNFKVGDLVRIKADANPDLKHQGVLLVIRIPNFQRIRSSSTIRPRATVITLHTWRVFSVAQDSLEHVDKWWVV